MFFFIGILIGIVPLCRAADKIRVVTWNVADNGKMGGSFKDSAIDRVLGLDNVDNNRPLMYAIGLEENCWNCNVKNLHKIGQRFLSRINFAITKFGEEHYSVVGIQGTRMSRICEIGCSIKTHGTTALLVIAKKSKVKSHSMFRQNEGCHGNWIKNKEKGIAAMKVTLNGGKTVCFGAGHLDSASSKYRRQCFKNFFVTANKETEWSDCDAQYLFGDFNTRTGEKTKEKAKKGIHIPKMTNFDSLRKKDELAGTRPYGTDSEWDGNLLDYINSLKDVNCKDKKKECFKECKFNFMPTYSIESAQKSCSGKFPCYRASRPRSWTDRVLYNGGECVVYEAILEEYGDHLPVFAEYTLDF